MHRRAKSHSGHHRMHKFRRAGFRRPRYNVPVNIIETKTYFEAWVYCISFKKEDISISVLEDTLYISGTRVPDDDAPNFMLQEYPIKGFERVFELSEKVDKSKIKARMEDGVLKIHVPKTEAAQHPVREVEIE